MPAGHCSRGRHLFAVACCETFVSRTESTALPMDRTKWHPEKRQTTADNGKGWRKKFGSGLEKPSVHTRKKGTIVGANSSMPDGALTHDTPCPHCPPRHQSTALPTHTRAPINSMHSRPLATKMPGCTGTTNTIVRPTYFPLRQPVNQQTAVGSSLNSRISNFPGGLGHLLLAPVPLLFGRLRLGQAELRQELPHLSMRDGRGRRRIEATKKR